MTATRPFRLGLTGSIGMGKSTTARLFAEMGVPVWDADAAVHRLYAPGGAAVAPLAALHPAALRAGGIDRVALKEWIATDPQALPRIEAVVHPLVAADRDNFAATANAPLIVFDIPLLFEKGTEAMMDATLLVTAPPALQRARVLARPGMTLAQFETILAIETLSLDAARAAVRALIDWLVPDHA